MTLIIYVGEIYIILLLLFQQNRAKLSSENGDLLIFEVKENSATGTIVGRVNSHDFPAPFEIHEFQSQRNLKIFKENGSIIVVENIDREKVSFYTYFIISANGETKNVRINVKDENDNAPRFNVTSLTKVIPENYPIGSKIDLTSIFDPDEGVNSVENVEITRGDPEHYFGIDYYKSDDGYFYVRLVLLKQIDFESTPQYSLIITAVDGGSPRLRSFLSLKILIDNANDNAPKFDLSRYVASVKEDHKLGVVILQVRATDKDIGQAGELVYFLDNHSVDSTMFSINIKNGAISLKTMLDYEKKRQLTLNVAVRDNVQPYQTSRTSLIVDVVDVNDNFPRLEINWPKQNKEISLNMEPYTLVAHVIVTDLDSVSTDFSITILNNCPFILIKVLPKMWELKNTDSLKLITTDNVTIVLEVTDFPPPSLKSKVVVTIPIVRNELVKYTFSKRRFIVDLHNPISTPNQNVTLITLSQDLPLDEKNIFFSLSNNQRGLFMIGSHSGLIVSALPIDCGTYHLHIILHSNKISLPMDQAQLIVNIKGTSKSSLYFSDTFTRIPLLSSAKKGDCPSEVMVANTHCKKEVTYKMETLINGGDSFQIINNGKICYKKGIEKVIPQRQFYKVVASEKGSSDAATNVLFVSTPSSSDLKVLTKDLFVTIISLNRSLPSARVISTFKNYPPYVYYGIIHYSLKSQGRLEEKFIKVDKSTGDIVINEGLFFTKPNIEVEIFASTNYHNAPAQAITVTLLAAAPQRFSHSLYEFHISLDYVSQMERIVGQVNVDQFSRGSSVSFQLKESSYGEMTFSIDSTSGLIKVKNLHLQDYVVSLNVIAKFEGNMKCYAQVLVMIDKVLSPPSFLFTTINVNIWENTEIGTELVQMIPTMSSWMDHYSICYGKYSDYFTIHPTTGQVFLQKTFDREETQWSIITVELKNKWGSVKSDIDFNILDNNDNKPFCKESVVNFTLKDSAPLGLVICPLQCSDDDSLDNGNLTYMVKMISPNLMTSPLGVQVLTGCIEVKSSLDLWQSNPLGTYTYYVQVWDNGRNKNLSTEVKINVRIIDTNNHKPYIKSYPVFHVLETASFGSEVGRLILEDDDFNNSVEVKINDQVYKQWFYADNVQKKETILRSRHIRGIKVGSHNVSLTLQDNGNPSLTSLVNVTVIIDDCNDNDPEIMYPKENQNVTHPCPLLPGSEILKINARDIDLGYNSMLIYYFNDKDTESLFSVNKWSGVITSRIALRCFGNTRLQIFVSDMGYPKRISSVTFVLSSERNKSSLDLANLKNLNFIIPKNAQEGMIIGDLLINPWSWLMGVKYLFGGLSTTSPDNLLHIDYETQRLILLKNDFNLKSKIYPITIMLHKARVPPRSFNFQLTIQSDKVKKSWLSSFEELYVIKVKENQPPGTTIARFSPKFAENNNLVFSLRQPDNFFVLDKFTGKLVTFISLDREMIVNDEFFIEIIVNDVGDPNETIVLPVHVVIEDVNDNAPMIISPVNKTVEVMVSDSKNDSVTRLMAVDRDKGVNGQFHYSLQENDMFTINPYNGFVWLIGTPTLKVYDVYVYVTDYGDRPLTSWTMLTFIIINDVMDNRIRFSSNTFSMNLSTSNSPYPSILGRVTLAPHSLYYNPHVTFQLIAGKFSNLIDIDPVKGDIKLSSQITPSSIGPAEMLKLTVITFFQNEPSNYDVARLLLRIDHGNNHAPFFTKSNFIIKLPEGEAITDFLTVAANDPDLGVFGVVTYQLIGDIEDKRISIDSDTGRLSCSSLDYVDRKLYNLQVVATDSLGGPLSRNQSAFIEVVVLNTKQQPLKFNSTHFVLNVKEGSPRGTIIGSVTVHRRAASSKVVYLLSPGHPLININTSNGLMTINGPFDREEIQSLDLIIQAIFVVPESQTFQSTDAFLHINILDVNDNAPIPSQNPTIIRLSNSKSQTLKLAKLSATDRDLESNITFHFDLNDPATKSLSSQYLLEPLTGILKSKKRNFGRDKDHEVLKVVVSDNGSPAKNTRMVVHVQMKQKVGLLNVTPEEAIFRVMENPSVGSYIGQINIPCNCSSNKISFSIIDADRRDLVYLHESSGKLFVSSSNSIDREQIQQIVLWTQVQCLDTDLVGYKKVIINVDDVDDNRPVFSQKEYIAFVLEGQPPKTTVVRTIIYDPDIGINSQVEYFIESYSSLDEFSIDSEGTIHTNIPLNFHIKSLYTLVVKATSKSTPLLFCECRVTVHIVNINDQRPTFSSTFLKLQIPEDKPVGSLLTTIIAKDSDGQEGVSYRIRPRVMINSTRFLSVAYDSGEIFLSRKIKPFDIGRHAFDIVADDGKYSSFMTLEVEVQDVNNQYPILLEDGYDFIVSESMPVGSILLYLHGSDGDFGVNGDIFFEINPPVSWLSIQDFQNNTSALVLTSKPFFSSKVQFVGIQLTDKAKDPLKRLTSMSTIVLLTESSNAHQPYFLNRTQINLKLPRSTSLGSRFAHVKCLDEEDSITYWINNTNLLNNLYVDSKSGDIFFIRSLENYTENILNIQIYCIDNGKPQRKTVLYLSINIDKREDKLPNITYEMKGYRTEIFYNSKFPLLVGNLEKKERHFWDNTLYKLLSATPNYPITNMTTSAFHLDEMGNIWLLKSVISKQWNLLLRINNKRKARRDLSDLYFSSYARIVIKIEDSTKVTLDKCAKVDRLTAVIKENDSPSVSLIKLPTFYHDMKYTMAEDDNFLLSCTQNMPSNCKLQSRTTLDFETNEQYQLSLVGTGTTSTKRSCSQTLFILINVLDVDEFYPIFSTSQYSFSVPGEVPKVGSVLYTVRASDRDGGTFGLVSYQLENNQYRYLSIREDSGEIYVKSEFPTAVTSRTKRSAEIKEGKRHERKTFTLNVIASSGYKSSTVTVKLNMLVPYVAEGRSPGGILISLTALQIGLIIALPTLIVVVAIIIAVLIYVKNRKRGARTGTVRNDNDGSRPNPVKFNKHFNDSSQRALPLPRKGQTNNYNEARRLPDVTLLSNNQPSNNYLLRNSETQEFLLNSEDFLSQQDNRNTSTLSHSSGTSSLRVEDSFNANYGSEFKRNDPPSSQFCDSGLGHTKRTCNCYIPNNSFQPDHRNNVNDSDFSGTTSSVYSAISQKYVPNQQLQGTQFNSAERKQMNIRRLREGPITLPTIPLTAYTPNKAVYTRSTNVLVNDSYNPDSIALQELIPIMPHSNIDLRNNNQQYNVSFMSPMSDERSYGMNIETINYPRYALNSKFGQVISVDVPPYCAISNPSESSSHHDPYAQPYSDVTDIDC